MWMGLDLWDTVRFRIVVNDVESLSTLSGSFQTTFAPAIIRCKNYYQTQRTGYFDPYRDIPFELEGGGYDYAEVQMITPVRD